MISGSECTRFTKSSHHSSPYRSKLTLIRRINIFEAIFKAKIELNNTSNLCFFQAFEIVIPCLAISFGEVTARVSLNVAINGSLIGRKTSKKSILRLLF